MTGAHILPDDLVIIQPRQDAENGDIVAARLGEEATVKRFWRNGSKIELQAQNPTMPLFLCVSLTTRPSSQSRRPPSRLRLITPSFL